MDKPSTSANEDGFISSQADEGSKRKSQLLSECEALRVLKRQRQEQIKDLKGSVRDSKERQANTTTEIKESEDANVAIVLERDVEHADYEKQMEESEAEIFKQLSNIKSSWKAVIDIATEIVNDIEKMEKIRDSTDNEMNQLRDELTMSDVFDLNKDLSTEAGSSRESSANVEEMIAQEKADFETLASEDQSNRLDLANLRRYFEAKKFFKLHVEISRRTNSCKQMMGE